MQCFTSTTATSEAHTIILKCPNKYCDLDYFPTFLLKCCIDQLIHPITTIINMSIQDGVVPDDFKQAMVNLLIEKLNLGEKNLLKNYSHISKMSFLSIVLEKVIANRIHDHISSQHLSNVLQSTYKRFHSTEKALLKIHNDIIICNMDNGKLTAFIMLDLYAAFDTIDHDILLQRLHRHFAISDTAFLSFSSYLSNRYQRINISGSRSCPKYIPFGVPQGSVLGPVLFSLYTTSLGRVITIRNINLITYMLNSRNFVSLSPTDTHTSKSTVTALLTSRRGGNHVNLSLMSIKLI